MSIRSWATNKIQGLVAHDAVYTGNPVGVGGFATDNISGVADVAASDLARILVTLKGNQIIAMASTSTIDGDADDYIRVLSETDAEGILAAGLVGSAPDGAADRAKLLGDTAGAGLGVMAAAPWIPGASDVKSITVVVGATSVNRATILTPSGGKKVRILSVALASVSATAPDKVGVYFGTGAAYLTNPTTVIGEYQMGVASNGGQEWPDGGGPIGAADAVVSWITETETEVGLDITIQYREE